MKMKRIKLKNFEHKTKQSLKNTSVKIRPEQLDFIREKNLNLSKLVRALLDNLIDKNKG